MDLITVILKIQQFLMQEINITDSELITETTDLFSEGILDSIMYLSLFEFCNSTFGVDVRTTSDESKLSNIQGIAEIIVEAYSMQGPLE